MSRLERYASTLHKACSMQTRFKKIVIEEKLKRLPAPLLVIRGYQVLNVGKKKEIQLFCNHSIVIQDLYCER